MMSLHFGQNVDIISVEPNSWDVLGKGKADAELNCTNVVRVRE
jgi:hypothetical protein